MTGERDLAVLLRSLEPELHEPPHVFVTWDSVPDDVEPVVTVREAEGITLVVPQAVADSHGLPYEFEAAMITLRIHSDLTAVGLTAAVASALSDQNISCNVVAGYFHDHLFVPWGRRFDAIGVLESLVADV